MCSDHLSFILTPGLLSIGLTSSQNGDWGSFPAYRQQIVRLGAAISANKMTSIAEGYMDIDDATIRNKKYENKDDAEAFNRAIIRHWANKNPENQVQVSEFFSSCFHRTLTF